MVRSKLGCVCRFIELPDTGVIGATIVWWWWWCGNGGDDIDGGICSGHAGIRSRK